MNNRNFETQGDAHRDMLVQLDLLRANLSRGDYPGYPAFNDRFFADISTLDRDQVGRLALPAGPWSVDTHPNRPDTDVVPAPAEQQKLAEDGLELDSQGRPLHPWLANMLEDPKIGIVTGKGAYWQWGPNKTVDAVVTRRGEVLLIKRGDTGAWALPGGFQDNEPAIIGAAREVAEETGVIIPGNSTIGLAYHGPVVDTRVTANAWPETTAFRFDLPSNDMSELRAGDDAADAAWFPFNIALQGDLLFGSHHMLLERALYADTN